MKFNAIILFNSYKDLHIVIDDNEYCCDDLYTPMHEIIFENIYDWTIVNLNLSNTEVSKNGIVPWCIDNVSDQWTIIGNGVFGFLNAEDALSFKIKFGVA